MNRHARGIARDLAHAYALAHDLALTLPHDRDLAASDRARARDLAAARARALARAHARALDLPRDLTHARDLVSTLERVLARARELERILQAGAPGDGTSIPGRVSRGLVALAVRVLPVQDRPRYAEEFRMELRELPRSERREYALRTLSGAWELRRALTETVRTPDGAPARRATER